MKSLFKLFFILNFLCATSFAKEVNFIHITDMNLNSNNAKKAYEIIKEINSYPDIDFVVFGGNNIAKPNFNNLEIFLYLFKKVNKKAYVLLGSNDVLSTSGITKEYYLKRVNKASFFKHSKEVNYIFKKNGYIFIAMDGTKQFFQSQNGYYTKKELEWLENNLKKFEKEKVIILQHFPLLETESKWIETAKMQDYKEMLSKYKNVKVIVSGHYNKNTELTQDGIYHILTEDFSKNNAYKIIQIDLDDDFIGTYLVK